MPPFQFDISPYTVTAIALAIGGLASVIYMMLLKEKPAATRFMILGLAVYSLIMGTMVLQSVVYLGGAVYPLVDALSMVSMAIMIEFVFHFPEEERSILSYLLRATTLIIGLGALFFSIVYCVQILVFHHFNIPITWFYIYLNPLTFLLALGSSIYRTIVLQNWRPAGFRGAVEVFIRPQNRPARLMRNFSLALSIGLVQGFVSSGLLAFPPTIAAIFINLSLLLMFVAIVYASFDFTTRQPGLVVRLVGLSLVTLLAILGVVDMLNANFRNTLIQYQYSTVIENARRVLRGGQVEGMPPEVVYILRWPLNSRGEPAAAGTLVTAARPNFDARLVLHEDDYDAPLPVWYYEIQKYDLPQSAANSHSELRWHYGSHLPGSYHQYAGFVFDLDGVRYEVGLSLEELTTAVQSDNIGIIWGVFISAIFILIIFPLSFRVNLTQPLNRLLLGMRRLEAGDLDVQIEVTQNDEVGFLTSSFNKMIISLKQELEGRLKAEDDLRRLNQILEERVVSRTRELEAMYDLSAAGNQTSDPQTLLKTLLDHSLNVMRTPLGFILLFRQFGERHELYPAAESNLPPEWSMQFLNLSGDEAWITGATALTDPLLINNTHDLDDLPAFISQGEALTLLLAPMQAEGQVLGLLGMGRPVQEKFTLDEVALLVSITGQIGMAVHSEQLRLIVQQGNVLQERQRLARSLHDSVTQSLYELVKLTENGMGLDEMRRVEEHRLILEKIGQSARHAIREMRLFIHQLRPPELEKEGLINALDLRLAAVEGRSDVKAQLDADESIHLPPAVENALYQISQEALNNALKHARARNVRVTLKHFGGDILLEVIDDGRGFSPQSGNYPGSGLDVMQAYAREIGAVLEVASLPGAGTRVTARLAAHTDGF